MDEQLQSIENELREQFVQNSNKYYHRLFSRAYSLVKNRADAEDIAQQALVQFFGLMEKREWRQCVINEEHYLLRSAVHLVINDFRRSKAYPTISRDDEKWQQTLENKPMQDDLVGQLEEKQYYKELFRLLPMNTILGDLTLEELKLLSLRVIDEMPFEDIAQELNKEVEAVRYAFNRVMTKVRTRARNLVKDADKPFQKGGTPLKAA
jgi:RNA polymerase sigma factor (sigma-70 family)